MTAPAAILLAVSCAEASSAPAETLSAAAAGTPVTIEAQDGAQDKKVPPPKRVAPPAKKIPGSPVGGRRKAGAAKDKRDPGATPVPQTGELPDRKAPPVAPQYAGEKDPEAKLAIDFGKEKHDFGSARQGDILEHTFDLMSSGKNPVKIRQASPTCGCTVSEIRISKDGEQYGDYKMGDPIEPGDHVKITGKLDTASKTNKTQVRINVYTNDPIGLTQLALAADIEPFIKATPSFINLGDIKEGQAKTQVIDIRTSRGEPVMLQHDATNPIKVPPGMEVDLAPVSADDKGRSSHWRATVSVGEGTKEGPIGYQLRLISDIEMPTKAPKGANETAVTAAKTAPKHYTVTSSINGRVLGVLSFTPQFLSMGLVRPGQRVTRNVKVISHDPNFELSDVKVELQGEAGQDLAWKDYFSYTVKPATGLNNAVDVQLRLDGLPDGADGSFRGLMAIHTGHEAKPQIDVRFSGVCRAGVTKPVPAKPVNGGK